MQSPSRYPFPLPDFKSSDSFPFSVSSCSQPSNVETALKEQILHFGLGAEPQHLDPHLATSVAAHNILTALWRAWFRRPQKFKTSARSGQELANLMMEQFILFIYDKMQSGVMAILLPTISFIHFEES